LKKEEIRTTSLIYELTWRRPEGLIRGYECEVEKGRAIEMHNYIYNSRGTSKHSIKHPSKQINIVPSIQHSIKEARRQRLLTGR